MNNNSSVDPIHLDFEQARIKHLLFKTRLRSLLYGADIEEAPVVYHYQCTVGKWIYGHALQDYAAIPEMHELERVHAELHTEARRLVTLYKEGMAEKAREGLDAMEVIADRLVSLLTLIETKVQQSPAGIVSNKPEQHTATINVEELYELQRLNLDLGRRMREQAKELQQTNQSLQLAINIGGLGVYKIEVIHQELFTNTTLYSEQIMDWFGFSEQHLPLTTILSRVHPEDQVFVRQTLEHSLSTKGVGRHDITYRVINSKDGALRHLRSIGQVQYEKEVPVAISGIIQEVTEQVLSRQKIEVSEAKLQQRVIERTAELEQQKTFVSTILDASFNGVYALQAVRNESGAIADFRYLFVNTLTARFFNTEAKELVGKSMLALIPENKTNGFFDLFCRVLEKGEPVQEQTHFVASTINNWFDYTIVPIDKDTLVVTLQDITEQKKAALQIEEQKNLLDNILKHSPSGITVTEMMRDEEGKVKDGRTILANAISERYVGIPIEQLLTSKISAIDPGMLHSPLFQQALHTLETGEPFLTQYYLAPTGRWLELSVAKMDDCHLINLFTDVTTLKNAQLEIEQAAARLSAVFNNAQSAMFTFAPVRDKEGEIIDFRFVITNPNFTAYVGQTPEVLKGALGSTWFPGYLHNGVFDQYKQTYLTGETLRKDVHYKVDQHDLYLDLMSTKLGEEVLVTFTDYTPLKRAQLQLEKYVEDLKRSNVNLEEFAYAASHDLKEPIRKIHTFADRIKLSMGERMKEQEAQYFDRLEAAIKRMNSLIDDLLTYSQVSARLAHFEPIDLNSLIAMVLEDLDMEIEQRGAIIKVDELFTITGHSRQLQQAFQNLIGNALKYSKPDVLPYIHISCSKIIGKDTGLLLSSEQEQKQYYRIAIKDNGIGFAQDDADRIFNVFTRLHGNTEYRGTGVGLSIVRKVVENHTGYITAQSEPGKGATFNVYVPVE